jgi:hypothetical protein
MLNAKFVKVKTSFAVAVEDLESGMTSVGEHGDQILCDSHFGQKHLTGLVPEDRSQQIKEVVFTEAMPYGLVGKMLEKELKRWTRPESIPATHLLLATSKSKILGYRCARRHDVLEDGDKVSPLLAHVSPTSFSPSMESQKRIDGVLSPGFLSSFTGTCPP